MFIDRYLIHTCTIERATESQGSGGEVKRAWTNSSTGVACRLMVEMQDMPVEMTTAEQRTRYTLLLKSTADVQDGDRIADVAFEDGSTEPGPFEILALVPVRSLKRLNHYRLELERID